MVAEYRPACSRGSGRRPGLPGRYAGCPAREQDADRALLEDVPEPRLAVLQRAEGAAATFAARLIAAHQGEDDANQYDPADGTDHD